MRSIFRTIGALASVFCVCGFAQAVAPPNDNWSDRKVVAELPFSDTLANIKDATTEGTDPDIFCWFQSSSAANPGEYSVWYGFTTGSEEEYVDLDAGGYDTIVAIYEGEPSAFVGVRAGCNDDGAGRGSGSILHGVRLRANTAYSIIVAHYPVLSIDPETVLAFSMSRSAAYTVTKTEDSDDGSCDADCSLREAVQQSIVQPGAVLIPAGHYSVPGGLNFGEPNSGGGNLYGAGMTDTVIDAMGNGRVVTYPYQEASRRVFTYGLHDLTLTNGSSASTGGAVYSAYAYLVLDRVALTDSVAQTNGGGVLVSYGAASFFDTLVSGNRAMGNGGGLYMHRYNLEIHDSTFSANESLGTASTQGGGAVYLNELFSEFRLANTTISGNRAASNAGGVYLNGVKTARINNVSIVGNTYGEGGAPRIGGLLVKDFANDIAVSNSVLSGNRAADNVENLSDCGMVSSDGPPQLPMTTHHNLVQAPGSCGFSSPTDLVGMDPLLSALGLYQSLLPVHIPTHGSPLIDAGDPADSCAPADARGIDRPQDGDGDGTARCDIGAIELTAFEDRIFADGFD